MKKIQSFFILMALCGAFTGCYKDKGNYDYHPVNELSFSDFNTDKGYSVDFGEMLTISPKMKGTIDVDGTKGSYSYEWSLDLEPRDSVISTEKALNVKLQMPPGKYTLQYIVKDNASGVKYGTKTQLLVTTKVFEGYMVLNEVNGKSRLDMLTYFRTEDKFVQHTDVLAEMGSALPVQGKPLQVFCMESEVYYITPQTYRIYIVTETGTHKIDPETFGYGPLDNFRYDVTGDLPSNFKPLMLAGGLQYGFQPLMFFTEGTNVYKRGYGYPTFPYVPVNVYAGEGKPFKAFPQIAANDDMVVIYDTEKRVFTAAYFNDVNVTEMPPDAGFPVGKDMVYMDDDQPQYWTAYGYAVLKDPGVANYYLLRFYPGFMFADFYEPIMNATDIDKATHFAVSPELGYVFYTVGGKLYEYDPFVGRSFLMLDKGNSEITHISFQKFFNSSSYDKYFEWGKLLTVGTYDPAGTEGSNGTLELYSVPPVNAPLQRMNVWNGFGRIASVSYRERN